jgi:hypothetical protein
LGAANSQLSSQKLPCRLQAAVIVIVIVIAGFAVRFRERNPASPDLVEGDPASPDFVKG